MAKWLMMYVKVVGGIAALLAGIALMILATVVLLDHRLWYVAGALWVVVFAAIITTIEFRAVIA